MGKNFAYLAYFTLTCALLSGCGPVRQRIPSSKQLPTYNALVSHERQLHQLFLRSSENNQAIAELKSSINVTDALPPVRINNDDIPVKKESQKKFDISVNGVSIQQFALGLMQNTDQNIVLAPNLAGKISLSLRNVTLQQALQTLSSVYNYQITKNSFGYKISTPTLQTAIFTINALNIKRSGASSVGLTSSTATEGNAQEGKKSSGTGEGSSSVVTSYTNQFWEDLEANLKGFLGASQALEKNQQNQVEVKKTSEKVATHVQSETMSDGASERIDVDPSTGLIVVHAYPATIQSIAQYLQKVQAISDRQVLIDAKIIKVQLGQEYSFGVDWDYFAKKLQRLSGASIVGQWTGDIFKFSGGGKDKDKFILQALSLQGKVSVLSSPRITTLNNQKAVIRVGSDEFYSTGTSSSTSPFGGGAQMTSDVNLSPFFSGISLDVTPQISADNSIKIHVHPVISKVTRKNVTIKLPGASSSDIKDRSVEVIPTASTSVEESDSIVSAKNNQLIIIGGLMEGSADSASSGAPTVTNSGRIKNVKVSQNDKVGKTELIILLKPTIMNDQAWSQALKEHVMNNYGAINCMNSNCLSKDAAVAHAPFVSN